MKSDDFSERQYEVHLTAPIDNAPSLPEGFSELKIANKDKNGNIIQVYVLHTCRFTTEAEIPWHFEPFYQRFKVERKILKAFPATGKLLLNHEFFRELSATQGVEIHLQTDQAYADMLSSSVNDSKHQTVFLPLVQSISLELALSLVEKYGRNASKLYMEAVIYDNNPQMDRDWQTACH